MKKITVDPYENINMEQAQTLTLHSLFVQSNCLLTIFQGAVGLVVSPLGLLYCEREVA